MQNNGYLEFVGEMSQMEGANGFKIFVSHTNGPADMDVVRQITSRLGTIGVQTYVAEEDRQPGNYIAEKIKRGIEGSNLVVGIWTQDSSNSAYVNQELGYAEGRVPCFLFVQKGTPVEGFTEGREYIEFDKSDLVAGLANLTNYMEKHAISGS